MVSNYPVWEDVGVHYRGGDSSAPEKSAQKEIITALEEMRLGKLSINQIAQLKAAHGYDFFAALDDSRIVYPQENGQTPYQQLRRQFQDYDIDTISFESFCRRDENRDIPVNKLAVTFSQHAPLWDEPVPVMPILLEESITADRGNRDLMSDSPYARLMQQIAGLGCDEAQLVNDHWKDYVEHLQGDISLDDAARLFSAMDRVARQSGIVPVDEKMPHLSAGKEPKLPWKLPVGQAAVAEGELNEAMDYRRR